MEEIEIYTNLIRVGMIACIAVIIIAFKYVLFTSSKEDEMLSNLKDVSRSLKNLSSIDNRLESLDGALKNIDNQINQFRDSKISKDNKDEKRIYVPDERFRTFLVDSGVGHDGFTPQAKSVRSVFSLKSRLLSCNDNQLTSLDVSSNHNLIKCHVFENQLTSY